MSQRVIYKNVSAYCSECAHVGHDNSVCYANGKNPRPPHGPLKVSAVLQDVIIKKQVVPLTPLDGINNSKVAKPGATGFGEPSHQWRVVSKKWSGLHLEQEKSIPTGLEGNRFNVLCMDGEQSSPHLGSQVPETPLSLHVGPDQSTEIGVKGKSKMYQSPLLPNNVSDDHGQNLNPMGFEVESFPEIVPQSEKKIQTLNP